MSERTTLGTALAALALGYGFLACSSSKGTGAPSDDGGPGAATGPTYYGEVKALLDAKCTQCHSEGGIAPFSLTDGDGAAAMHGQIASATGEHVMPPWPPDAACATYKGDRSLTDAEIALLARWSAAGAPLGTPSGQDAVRKTASSTFRIDHTLTMPDAYTPQIQPDDYRCFLLDWPETETRYVTAFGVRPGTASAVHHVLSYVVPADGVAELQALDDKEPGPGYPCFGGPGNANLGRMRMLAGWAPGSLGTEMPEGSGIRVDPGSKIVMQVHYNGHGGAAVPDTSSIAVKIESSVTMEAYTVPFANPSWVTDRTMPIPAGNPDVVHKFDYEASAFLAAITQGAIKGGSARVHAAALHMHTRGARANLRITHPDASEACLLSIQNWDFHWQGSYGLSAPVTVNPGDHVALECHFDNSAAHQPFEDGRRVSPTDLNWGEGTGDEMCLGYLFVTR